jgi:uncharacterized iron-regulated membrane protein
MKHASNVKRASRSKWSAARAAHTIHTAGGLWFTLVLTLVMGTGTLAVFGQEIDRLIYPELRVSPAETGGERVNPGALYDALLEKYDGLAITHIDTAADTPYLPANTYMAIPGKGQRLVTIDQYGGEVLGDLPMVTVRMFILRVHAALFHWIAGFYVVNFCGLALLVTVVAGLFAYRKFWRGFFKKPRFGRGGRILLGDLHKLVSLWTLPFLLIIGITGTWYFYNFPLAKIGLVPDVMEPTPVPTKLSREALSKLGPQTPVPLSGAEIVSIVRAAHPDMTVTGLMPPMNRNMPFVVYGERGEYLMGDDPNAVYVNPYSGEIIGATLSEDLRLSQHIFQTMSKAHDGEFIPHGWGYGPQLTMKFVWFLCGLGGTFLSVSGLLIYLRRARKIAAGSRLARVWLWIRPWGGPMGVFKYANLFAMVLLATGVYHFAAMTLAPRPAMPRLAYEQRRAGSFGVSVSAAPGRNGSPGRVLTPGGRIMVSPHIAEDRFRDAKDIFIGVDAAQKDGRRGARVKGPEKTAFAPVTLPSDLAGATLWIRIKQWDGSVHRAEWPLQSGQAGKRNLQAETNRKGKQS